MRIPIQIVFLFLTAVAACFDYDGGEDGPRPIDLGPPFQCVDRPDDTSGYLQPICQHIVDSLGEYEIDPNTLQIESITPVDATTDQVQLSCCFSGDVAVMDRATKTVQSFSPGDH
jgi:hypothetical protein